MSNNPYQPPIEGGSPTPQPRRGFRWRTLLLAVAVVGLVILLIVPMRRRAGPAAFRMQCQNNLKQIALAIHNYEDTYHSLPPAYTTDADGTPLHSWRTLLLPFLEQQSLYESIDFTKSWLDPANAHAREVSLQVFRCPSLNAKTRLTTYMAIVAPNGVFRPGQAGQWSEITDATGDTVMVIEVSAGDAVHWMAPRDTGTKFLLNFGPEDALPHPKGVNAVFADGSMRFLSAELPGAERRAIISISGNETVDY